MRIDTRKNRSFSTNQVSLRQFATEWNFLDITNVLDLLLKLLHFVGQELDNDQKFALVFQVRNQFFVENFRVVEIFADKAEN